MENLLRNIFYQSINFYINLEIVILLLIYFDYIIFKSELLNGR